jgi:hypothetical protein
MEGMAAAEPLHTQPETSRGSMGFNCFTHVFRTRGVISTGRGQQGRNQEFVPAEEEDKDAAGGSLHLMKKRLTSL